MFNISVNCTYIAEFIASIVIDIGFEFCNISKS